MGAGGSARRGYERIRDARRQRLRNHRSVRLALAVLLVVGGAAAGHVILGVWWVGALAGLATIGGRLAPSQRQVARRKGAEVERTVGRALDALGADTRALHDRRIPGCSENIDHILVTPTGVWTIDAKNYAGKIETRRRGQQLWIAGRNRSKLLEQARRQAAVVRQVLAAGGLDAIPVTPVLCVLGVEWPLVMAPQSAGGVRLLPPRGLHELTSGAPMLSATQIERADEHLDRELQPATELRPSSPSAPPTGTPQALREGRAHRQ